MDYDELWMSLKRVMLKRHLAAEGGNAYMTPAEMLMVMEELELAQWYPGEGDKK